MHVINARSDFLWSRTSFELEVNWVIQLQWEFSLSIKKCEARTTFQTTDLFTTRDLSEFMSNKIFPELRFEEYHMSCHVSPLNC